ncbi:MAG: dihydrolipoyllysine-residue acetyltransferase [Acidobacteriota bacterium]
MAEPLDVRVPDIGDFDEVIVIEVLVAAGDTVAEGDSLIVLESDKASMDVPSPAAGTVREVRVSEDQPVEQNQVILVLETDGASDASEAKSAETTESTPAESKPAEPKPAEPKTAEPETAEPKATESSPPDAAPGPGTLEPLDEAIDEGSFAQVHAGPGTRKLARELGVDLGTLDGTGRKGRVTPDDVKSYVRGVLSGRAPAPSTGGGVSGFEWPQMPRIDFTRFGEVEEKKLSRIRKVSARNLHRSWLHVPHVTQHEDADVTEMEEFRKAQSDEAKKQGIKLTPVAFLLKASAAALRAFPDFNSSLHPDGDALIVKKYIHIGVAVDTDDGLVVPVVRDVDQKGLYQLADEIVDLSVKAREGKLMPQDFQGASFTISSLGGIGGTSFTPIVNAPEVAILGASRNRWTPVWKGGEFVPRLMLPLSLSYDHRVIDGASAARFCVHLAGLLGDLRRLLL